MKRCGISRKTAGGERLVSPWLIVDVSRAVVRRSRGGGGGLGGEKFNPDRGELSAGVAGEKFGPESVTGVERRVACHERNDAEGGAERANKGERRREREREREGGRAEWRLRGRRGDEPELERWQSIDLVGFTISFYLSLSFYISASPASLHELRGGAHWLLSLSHSVSQGFDFLPFGGYNP